MEEETAGTQEAQETQENTENSEEKQEAQKQESPEGYDLTDFSPEQQKRFNKVYRSMKESQKETWELRKIAKEQSDIIEQLREGQNKIVSHLQDGDYKSAESSLKEQRKAAYDRGDLAAVDEINDRLTDIKLQRKMAENRPKEQPRQSFNAGDAVTNAVQSGAISYDDGNFYRSWANETDDYGNLKRPWTNPGDHRNMAAAVEGRAVFSNPSFANKSFAEKLQEIDRRMGITMKQAQGQNVLPSGNLTPKGKNNNIKMSPVAEQIAIKTQFAGKGKTPQEHIEAYRAQMANVRGQK